jgi:hypothetical protein
MEKLKAELASQQGVKGEAIEQKEKELKALQVEVERLKAKPSSTGNNSNALSNKEVNSKETSTPPPEEEKSTPPEVKPSAPKPSSTKKTPKREGTNKLESAAPPSQEVEPSVSVAPPVAQESAVESSTSEVIVQETVQREPVKPASVKTAGRGLPDLEQKIVTDYNLDAVAYINQNGEKGFKLTQTSINDQRDPAKFQNLPSLEIYSPRKANYFQVESEGQLFIVPKPNRELTEDSLDFFKSVFTVPSDALDVITKSQPYKMTLIKAAKIDDKGQIIEKGEVHFK